jgi:acyl-coenzyme A synthetase/AMP-(fatty) acid ligase
VSNISELILANSRRFPEAIALETPRGELSYGALARQAQQARAALAARGCEPGAVVGFATRDAQLTIVTVLGAWLLGASAMILDFRKPVFERKAAADRFGCALFLEDSVVTDAGCPVLSVADWSAEIAAEDPEEAPVAGDTHPALIALSSGTAGTPAAVALSHATQIARFSRWSPEFLAEIQRRYLSTEPMAFAGSIGRVFNGLLCGGTSILFPTFFRPADLFDVLETKQVTGCALVPTVLRDLLRYSRESGRTLRHLTHRLWLITHGAPIQARELDEILERLSPNLLQIYGGLTPGHLALLDVARERHKIDTVGRPYSGITIEIVDEEDRPLPTETIGRLRINASGIGTPLGREEEFKDGWYYPGDLGSYDADGYLKLMGREGDVIVRGGSVVYLQDVEAVLSGVAGIHQVAAVGLADERYGQDLVLGVVSDLDAAAIGRIFRDRASPSHRPSRIVVLTSLPQNANGKIDKRAMASMLSEAR